MRTLTIGAIVCAAVALPHATRAATFVVNSTDDGVDSAPGDGVCVGPAGTCTLRGAILEANALAGADTITLPPGKFALQFPGADEDAGWKGDLDITDDLVINGAGETASIISGNRIDRIFDVHSPAHVTLSDVTITNGEPPAGNGPEADAGGMLNDGTVTLTNVTFFRNRAGFNGGYGGGLKNLGTATLMHATFRNNRAGNEVNFYANPYALDALAGSVGGMWNVGTATLTDVMFSGNRAGDGFDEAGDVGGMLNDGDAILTNITFSDNHAGRGISGGIGGFGGSVGGMRNSGTAMLTKVTFDRNRAGNGGASPGRESEAGHGGDGGGMENDGTATLIDVSFVGNRAGTGGIGNFGDGGFGGGLVNLGTATLTNVTIDHNRAGGGHTYSTGGSGGGMFNQGDATLTNVTMTRNRAGNGAGGGQFYGVGGSGGGLSLDPLYSSSATLTNVTLALNRAGRGTYGSHHDGEGNQLFRGAGGARLTNTIISGPGQSCARSQVSMGHNLDSGTTCGLTGTGDLSNIDPLLDTLKSNGGFTQTMALRPGSPAIDAGDNAACPATDQRGVARPQGARCDIGAYEVQP